MEWIHEHSSLSIALLVLVAIFIVGKIFINKLFKKTRFRVRVLKSICDDMQEKLGDAKISGMKFTHQMGSKRVVVTYYDKNELLLMSERLTTSEWGKLNQIHEARVHERDKGLQ